MPAACLRAVLHLGLALGLALAVLPARAQDPKTCALVLLPAKSGAAAVGALGRKLQTVCTPRAAVGDDLGQQVKGLRRQGDKRVVLVGHGAGANTAIAFAGSNGDTEGVVALGGEPSSDGGALPAAAAAMKQHVPLLWVVGEQDPLHARGEGYAFAKAPPHPANRFVEVKADAAGTPEAAAKVVADWLRELQ